ncbi:MAG: tetratricopeptide repeat protein, partial [Bifidobacterium mongoliense]|nr:tetratricopeptide repeat protein [Bifidobacterium mongoliense]
MSDEARRETDEAAGMYADTDVNSQNGSQAGSQPAGDGVPATFDTDRFLAGLDAIYEAHEAPTKAEPYLQQAMADAENAGNDAGLLTVLNEIMGFYRSQGRHDENQWIVQRAIELGLRLQLPGSEAWTTTLINAATAMRAAGRYDQAQDLYHQALESAKATMPAHDRRLA